MLKHEEQERQERQERHESKVPTSPVAAAPAPAANEARVTPAEIARAVAAIESRRSEGALRTTDTVAIGEALEVLGVEVSPEEVLAEVEGQRRPAWMSAEQAAPQAQLVRAQRVYGRMAAVALCLLLLFGWLVALKRSGMTTVRAPAYSAQTVVLARDARGTVQKTLGEVPDGRPVLVQLASDYDYTRSTWHVRVKDAAHSEEVSWPAVKHGGRLHVRGWIADGSDAALRGKQVTLCSQESYLPTGAVPRKVTLPVDGMHAQAHGGPVLYVEDFRPEAVFPEEW